MGPQSTLIVPINEGELAAMPRQAKALSVRRVETVKGPAMLADGNNLYLQVTAAGAKTWIFRYKLNDRRRDMGLGGASVVSLADAREKAHEARKLVAAGIDPIEARRHQEAAPAPAVTTFRNVAEEYIESHSSGWKSDKHAKQWRATLETYAYPTIGALAVERIDTALVVEILRPIWTTKTETAARVRGRIEAVLDYAKVLGKRAGENPARWKGHLDHILPAKADVARVEHHASLPYAEMPMFFRRLQVQDGISARALEFAILTACRTAEVLGARWDEIDIDGRLWTLPPERMKADALHRAPLSEPAINLLRKMETIRQGDYVFAGHAAGKPLSNMALAMALRRMKVDATPHGFRSTFRTWAAEKTSYPDGVCEAVLAHVQGDKVQAAYQRGDLLEKRRHLMNEWASYCTGASRQSGAIDRTQQGC